MFRKAFAGFEGKKSDGPALFVHDHAADYGAILVCDEIFGIQDFSGEVFVGFFWHGNTTECLVVRLFIKTCFEGTVGHKVSCETFSALSRNFTKTTLRIISDV